MQIGRAKLHRRGAQQQRRRDPARVADSAGGNDRDGDGVDDLRDQRHRSDRMMPRKEMPRMAAGFAPLRDDRVDALGGEIAGLANRGRIAEDERTCRAGTGKQFRLRQPEVEADDLGFDLLHGCAKGVVEWCA